MCWGEFGFHCTCCDEGTPGLWNLITEKTKGLLEGKYADNDLSAYEDILRQTSVLHQDFNASSPYPRSSVSWKWKNILAPIWKKWAHFWGTVLGTFVRDLLCQDAL